MPSRARQTDSMQPNKSGHQARKPPTRTSDNRRRSVVLGRGGSGGRRACRCGHGRVLLLLLLLGSGGRRLLLLAGTGDAGRRGLASWSTVVHGWVFERGLTSDTSPLLNFDHEATKMKVCLACQNNDERSKPVPTTKASSFSTNEGWPPHRIFAFASALSERTHSRPFPPHI